VSRSADRGFTLIELLVVLVIIGVIVGLASIGFSGNHAAELEREAKRLGAVLTLAGEEAIVKSREIGVRFDADGYRFFVADAEQTWVPLEDDREFAEHALPPPLALTLLADARAVRTDDGSAEAGEPQVYFFATGELYPAFELTLRHPELQQHYRIVARIDGKIELHAEE
jgi:general secretion pathway protein H